MSSFSLICFCNAKGVFPRTVLTLISVLFPAALDQARFKVGGYCQVCKMAITYVDELLEKNATEAQIEEAVRKACSFLPDSLQTEVRSCILSLCVTFTCPCVTAPH